MSIERVNPAELARPSGFSHAVVGRGTLVLLAGQTALDPAGRITGADMVAQFEVALGNLLTALAAAGGRPDQLASLTVYVVDMEDYRRSSAALGQVWRRLAVGLDEARGGAALRRLRSARLRPRAGGDQRQDRQGDGEAGTAHRVLEGVL